MIEPAERMAIRLTVNGRQVAREVTARRSLADFLRDDLMLTGTHVGCEHGVCSWTAAARGAACSSPSSSTAPP